MPDAIKRNELYLCDVLLYRGQALISRAIRLFDGTEVSHAGLLISNLQVGEALGHGLVSRSLDQSVAGAEWILARRLKESPEDMSPVERRGLAYIEQGNRYGYEQILLLTLLVLTRKPKVTPVLRKLVRATLDTAASYLLRLTANGKQPMICSEFVYRAYDEALPEAGDIYSLRIRESTLLPRTSGVMRGLDLTPPLHGQGIHPESLLAWIGPPEQRSWSGTRFRSPAALEVDESLAFSLAPSTDDALPSASTPELDTLIDRYLEEAKQPPTRTRSVRAADAVSDEELQAAVDRFALSLYAADTGDRETALDLSTRGRGRTRSAARTRSDLPSAFQHLFSTAADFVTPGDLLKSDSLYTLGRLA
jgi:hypothetical protein